MASPRNRQPGAGLSSENKEIKEVKSTSVKQEQDLEEGVATTVVTDSQYHTQLIFDSKAYQLIEKKIIAGDLTRIFDNAETKITGEFFTEYAKSIRPLDAERLTAADRLTANPSYKGYSKFNVDGQFKSYWKGILFGKDEKTVLKFARSLTQEITILTNKCIEENALSFEGRDYLAMLREKLKSEEAVRFYIQSAIGMAIQYELNVHAKSLDDLAKWPDDQDPRENYTSLYFNIIGGMISTQRVLYIGLKNSLDVLEKRAVAGPIDEGLLNLLNKSRAIGKKVALNYFNDICIDPVSATCIVDLMNDVLDSSDNKAIQAKGIKLLERNILFYHAKKGNLTEEEQRQLVEQQRAYRALIRYNKLKKPDLEQKERKVETVESESDRSAIGLNAFLSKIHMHAEALSNHILGEKTDVNEVILFSQLLTHLTNLQEDPHIGNVRNFIDFYHSKQDQLTKLSQGATWRDLVACMPGLFAHYSNKFDKLNSEYIGNLDIYADQLILLQNNMSAHQFRKNDRELFFELLNRDASPRNLQLLKMANSILELPSGWNSIYDKCIAYLRNVTADRVGLDARPEPVREEAIIDLSALLGKFEAIVELLPFRKRRALRNELDETMKKFVVDEQTPSKIFEDYRAAVMGAIKNAGALESEIFIKESKELLTKNSATTSVVQPGLLDRIGARITEFWNASFYNKVLVILGIALLIGLTATGIGALIWPAAPVVTAILGAATAFGKIVSGSLLAGKAAAGIGALGFALCTFFVASAPKLAVSGYHYIQNAFSSSPAETAPTGTQAGEGAITTEPPKMKGQSSYAGLTSLPQPLLQGQSQPLPPAISQAETLPPDISQAETLPPDISQRPVKK